VIAVVGLLVLGFGLKPRGGGDVKETAAPLPSVAAVPMPPAANKRVLRKVDKRAAALAKQGEVLDAAELCAESGLHDAAVEYFTQASEFVRAARL
jgi:hypothetical protein